MTYTPSQTKILKILADGERHTREELHSVCHPESLPTIVAKHVSILRKKLKDRNELIVCEYYAGSYFYRHVLMLSKDTQV